LLAIADSDTGSNYAGSKCFAVSKPRNWCSV
jgi:hypothetical protein